MQTQRNVQAMQWSDIRKLAEERVSLKRIKTYPRMSEETIAMNCDVWFDGKLVGYAENHGTGGENALHPASLQNITILDPFIEFIQSLPPVADSPDDDFPSVRGYLDMDVDLFLSMWIGDHEEERDFKRICKKKILMKMTDGNHYTVNRPYTPELAVMLREREGAELVEIINERYL